MCRLDDYSKTQLVTNNIQTSHKSWSNSKFQGDIAKNQVSTALNNKENTLWPITATPEDPWTIQGQNLSHRQINYSTDLCGRQPQDQSDYQLSMPWNWLSELILWTTSQQLMWRNSFHQSSQDSENTKHTSNQEQYHIHCTRLGMQHYPHDPKCTIKWKHFVISKVDKPTPWCAGMVVVPKKEGAIHICVDLKPLNENVLHWQSLVPGPSRILHPLPQGRWDASPVRWSQGVQQTGCQ